MFSDVHIRGRAPESGDMSTHAGADAVYTREEVRRRAEAGASILIVDGGVYDFGALAHPGGRRILERHAGRDASEIFRGVDHASDAGSGPGSGARAHAHSPAAHRMLRRLRVGRVAHDPSEPARSAVFPADAKATRGSSTPPPRETRNVRRSRTSPANSYPDALCGGASSVGSDDDASSDRSDAAPPRPIGFFELSRLASRSFAASDCSDPDRDPDPSSSRESFDVDFSEPLVAQVGHLGARYMDWVHAPETSSEPLRFFANPALEALSRTPWWAVPAIWTPAAAHAMLRATLAMASAPGFEDGRAGVGLGFAEGRVGVDSIGAARDAVAVVFSSDDGAAKLVAAVVAFAIGWVLWGFLEYAFHRFAFHRTPRGRLGIVAHFVAHGCHHKAPMDRWRLVFPPAASAPVIYAAGLAFDAVAPTQWLALFAFAGCLLGYVAYDCSHYAMHHAEFGWSRALAEKKSTHMAHHYVDCERSFGITSTFFDRVAGTHPETRDGGIRGRERGVEKPKVS